MILPEMLTASGVSAERSLDPQLRVSLLLSLNGGLRAAKGPIARSLKAVRDALLADALDDALRNLDSAWRSLPEHAAILAPIYGRLLSFEARDYDAALRLLQRAIEFTADADVEALIAYALWQLRRPDDARRQLEAALARYCVLPDSLLYRIAGELIEHPAIGAPGWIGRGPDLELVGELAADATSSALDISLDGQSDFTQLLQTSPNDGRRAFNIPCPDKRSLSTRIEAQSRGAALMGSGANLPSDFCLDGRGNCRGRRPTGWVRLGWRPTLRPRLRFTDEDGRRARGVARRAAQPGGRWSFELDLRAAGLHGSRIQIEAQLPDGRWQPLPDSPLLLERALRLPEGKPSRLPNWDARSSRPPLRRALSQNERLTDVIIPVYRGREESLACIDAVLATVDETARIIVVDDATDDAMLAAALDTLAAEGRITLLRNAKNVGFVASVNRALGQNPTHDVVLLNSDTVVFDDWLARLRAAAYSAPAVGTVTPLSNNGSIASYPRPQGAALEAEDAAAMHALAASTHSGIRTPIPVGVGFCLYIRRDCLQQVGSFDAAVFGSGYGEETDFCLRARRRGWTHQLAADVFVYHVGSVSFGARRAALLDRAHRLINRRHPGYDRFIASFLAQDPLQPLRRRLDERRLLSFDGRFVLLVTLSLPGGVDRFVGERCKSLRAQGLFPLILRPAEAGNAQRCELWTDALDLPNLRYDIPQHLPELTGLLGALRLETSEIQHFLHLDARVIEAVRALPVPYDIYVHDYAWICPRVTLIDGSGGYCGEPEVTVCRSCVRRNGSNLGEAITVPALRSRSDRWLRGARHIIAPSNDAAARMRHHFAGLEVQVVPHAVPEAATPLPPRPLDRKVARVAVIGAIGEHKGYNILRACARDAHTRRLPLEFVVIGYTQSDAPLLATGKVFITGRYSELEAPHLLRRERPDVAWLPSVAPETWCYTLDYALSSDLPVMAFDLGAIAERLRAAGQGMLLPLRSTPGQINDCLLQLAAGTQLTGPTALHSVQSPPAQPRDDAKMAARKSHDKHIVNKSSNSKPAPASLEDALSASVQILPLPAGLYLFSVKAASPVPARAAGQLSLPAVHVGLGPGVRSDQVEFIAGPSTHGAWLFAPGDLLVTKINGTGATLIMSSLRAPGGEVLSIKVERLEARADASPHAQPAIAATPPEANAATAQKRRNKQEDRLPGSPVFKAADDNLPLPVQIAAHIRTRGDMSFTNVPWAGRVSPGLWIESFSVRPLEQFAAKDIEYKGLTGSGFETPWLSDDKMCGTKGMAVPLVGFAVRLKPSETSAAYDCEYSGFFQSGVTVGPLRNGAPCRSTVANDPLEGIQVRLIRRSIARPLTATAKAGVSAAPSAPALSIAAQKTAAPPTAKANGAGKGSAQPKSKTLVRASVKPAKRPAAGDRRPTRRASQNRQSATRRP